MNKLEIIFAAVILAISIACINTMPNYYFMFLFLAALAVLFLIMGIFSMIKKRFENTTISIISYITGIILFIVYFISSVNMDLTNKGSPSDSTVILSLFVLVMFLGWFFEKNKN